MELSCQIICTICQTSLSSTDEAAQGILATPCGHLYHKQCLFNWFLKNSAFASQADLPDFQPFEYESLLKGNCPNCYTSAWLNRCHKIYLNLDDQETNMISSRYMEMCEQLAAQKRQLAENAERMAKQAAAILVLTKPKPRGSPMNETPAEVNNTRREAIRTPAKAVGRARKVETPPSRAVGRPRKVETLPSRAPPSRAVGRPRKAETLPSRATPSRAVGRPPNVETLPSRALPSRTPPSRALPSRTPPSRAVAGPPNVAVPLSPFRPITRSITRAQMIAAAAGEVTRKMALRSAAMTQRLAEASPVNATAGRRTANRPAATTRNPRR